MALENRSEEPGAGTVTPVKSHSRNHQNQEQLKAWLFMLAGFSGLVFVVLIMGMLLLQYYQHRPQDLSQETARLTERLEARLEAALTEILATDFPEFHEDPEYGIVDRTLLEPRRDANLLTQWTHSSFEVYLPETFPLQDLADSIHDDVKAETLRLEAEEWPEEHAFHWRIFYQELEFAEWIFWLDLPEATPEPLDLHLETAYLAEEMQALLLQMRVDPDEMRGLIVLGEEDDGMRWTWTSFEAVLPWETSLPKLWSEAAYVAEQRNAVTDWEEIQPGIWRMLVYMHEREVLDLRLIQSHLPEARYEELTWDDAASTETSQAEDPTVSETTLPEDVEAPPVPLPATPTRPVAPPLESLPLESDSMEEEPPSTQQPESDPQPESEPITPPVTQLAPGEKAKVAIVIDDGGYGGAQNEQILGLSKNLTLAILPNTPLGATIAEQAAALGFEIILHMPMQNNGGPGNTFPGEIRVDMDEETLRERTRDALEQIPHVVGMNNHTGSTFTADVAAMARFFAVFQELTDALAGDTPWYFLDSKTTGSSRAYTQARALGIPTASRDVFLDNVNEPDKIRAQFNELFRVAHAQGSAIAIGHFRPHTAAVLAEVLPTLEERGIELVPLSELVH